MIDRAAMFLTGLDPRVKIALAVILGLSIWRVSPAGVVAYLIMLSALLIPLVRTGTVERSMIKWAVLFVLGWTGLKFGLGLWDGQGAAASLPDALLLGARMLALILVGLNLALSTSPRQTGLAFAWAMGPFFRKKAWQPALALALMIHFLPLAWRTFRGLGQSLSLRGRELPFRRRMFVLVTAHLRVVSLMTWKQTLAVAARGLDSPQAWQAAFPPRPGHWFLGLAAAAAVLVITGV